MKNKFYKVGFMLSVFLLMHAIPFAEVSAETTQGEDFILEIWMKAIVLN